MSKNTENKILNKKRERANVNEGEQNQLKDDIIDSVNFNLQFTSNPTQLKFFQNLIDEKWDKHYGYENKFIIFKSVDDILYLIYTNSKSSIILYNIEDNKKINEINNAHKYNITDLQHFTDKKNQTDLILSIPCWIYDIKLWDINRLECIYNFKNNDLTDQLFSDASTFTASFCSNLDNYLIIIGRYIIFETDQEYPIEVYDFKGNLIKKIQDSNEGSYKIICYYDEMVSKQFIISSYRNYVKSFYLDENKIYHKYFENFDNGNVSDSEDSGEQRGLENNIIIYKEEGIIKLIDLYEEGIVRIWNFHSAELLKKIDIFGIYSICLWNNKYLFMGGVNNAIQLFELKNGEIINSFLVHEDIVKTIRKMIHPKYGECLVSQSAYQEDIKLWILS